MFAVEKTKVRYAAPDDQPMWFRKKQPNPPDVIRGLRQQALTVTSDELGLSPNGPDEVWGVVMETGYPEAVATLVVLGEGTTSLYFSNGGGVIGAGEHASVREAGKGLLSTAGTHVREFAPMRETPVPHIGRVRIYLRTCGGILGAEAGEQELGEGRHHLSPVFHAAHSVIAAVRQSTPE